MCWSAGAQSHILEPHIAVDAHRFRGDVPARLDRFVDDLEDALTGGSSGLHQLIELMQLVDRLV